MLAIFDWSMPWFAPWRGPGKRVATRCGAGAPLHQALNEEDGAPVRFVGQSELPVGEPYERHIHLSGTCPTRDNLHDFFNGLVWLRLPQAKRRINELQAGEIALRGIRPARGPLRDALTLFDENGALLDAPPAIWEALLARDWLRLFIDLRPLWAQARIVVFGHALLEKLVEPRKDITAHIWRFQCPADSMAAVDRWLAGQFTAGTLAAKPFTPLPVMGMPGWTPENETLSFYDDPLVFRPAGRGTSRT